LSGSKVLLVDDERDFVEALSERMRHRGLDVVTAVSAKDAIQMAQGETFDVIVLDLKMPEIDGLETLRILKKTNANTHFIVFTGYATAEKGIRAMLSGAEEVLEKPSNVETLVRKIEKLVSKKMVEL